FDDVGIRHVAGRAILLASPGCSVYLNGAVLRAFRGNICMGIGIFNSSTVIGQAIAPPALVLMQLAWGWRAMFVIIGVAGIPFLAAAVGMWVNGIVVDRLAKKGYDLAKTRKTAIVCGLMMSALGTLLVVQSSSPAQAVAFISMALFCVHFAGTSAWGLV
ncbi:hypothetical protein MAY81_31655, partial [Escherichia coli]